MTTRPTLEASKSVGTVLGAGEWNTNVLQQGNWTQEVLLGTNSDKLPGTALGDPLTVASEVRFTKNLGGYVATDQQAALLGWNIGNGTRDVALVNLATGATIAFNFSWFTGTGLATILQIDTGGKMTGRGFYDSGETSVGALANLTLTHGFSSLPRWVCGVYGISGAVTNALAYPDSGGGTISLPQFTGWDNANIYLTNGINAARLVHVFAIK